MRINNTLTTPMRQCLIQLINFSDWQ